MNKTSIKLFPLFLVIVALWLIATPLSYGYSDRLVLINDLFCGFLLLVFGIYSFFRFSWILVGLCALMGIWLNFAPLIFWAPEGLYYLNDTLIGTALLIIGSVLLNGETADLKQQDIPPGWSYNPSAWPHRALVICLASVCYFLARYLDSFELGYITEVWDPFFGSGTLDVLTSKISRSFPVPDAGLGALAYLMEALLAWQGGRARWRTMPWAVLGFGFLAVPVGIISITLIILQPLAVKSWCFLCLFIASCMLLIINLAIGEVIATLQCMKRERSLGRSAWKFCLQGAQQVEMWGENKGVAKAEGCFKAITPTWNLILILCLAVFHIYFVSKMQFPQSDLIVGPLLIVISFLSMNELLRSLRWVNILLAIWLLAYIWIIPLHLWYHLSVAVLVICLSIPKGKLSEKHSF